MDRLLDLAKRFLGQDLVLEILLVVLNRLGTAAEVTNTEVDDLIVQALKDVITEKLGRK